MNRKLKAFVFDVDGTLTKVTSPWQEIHERIGLWKPKGLEYLNLWLNKKISYEEFCELDVKLWNDNDIKLSNIKLILDSIPFRGPSIELLRNLNKDNIFIILLSTGIKYLAERIIRAAKIDKNYVIYSNEIYEYFDVLKVNVSVSGDRGSDISKGSVLKNIFDKFQYSREHVYALGDSESDYEMFELCDYYKFVRNDRDLSDVIIELS